MCRTLRAAVISTVWISPRGKRDVNARGTGYPSADEGHSSLFHDDDDDDDEDQRGVSHCSASRRVEIGETSLLFPSSNYAPPVLPNYTARFPGLWIQERRGGEEEEEGERRGGTIIRHARR